MKPNGKIDLSLVSTEALWTELASWCDTAILALLQDRGTTENAHTYYKGSAFGCWGLAMAIGDEMQDCIRCTRDVPREKQP